MLGNYDSVATVAVRDLDKAKAFYEGVLGLEPYGDSRPGTAIYRTGSASLLVYVSAYAGSNEATAVTWTIPTGIAGLVARLATAGVAFEHYEMDGLSLEGDLHVGYEMKIAWFKDPDGNIHALAEG